MKKLTLLAALVCGVSFSSMATDISNKGEKISVEISSRAVTQSTDNFGANKLKNLKLRICAWVSFSVGCGDGGDPYLGHIYACGAVAVLDAKISLWEQYCN